MLVLQQADRWIGVTGAPDRRAAEQDVRTVIGWLAEFITRPHPLLGRNGPVCPFVRPAADVGELEMCFHYDVDGTSPAELVSLVTGHLDMFVGDLPVRHKGVSLTSRIVVLPGLLDATAVDECHRVVKDFAIARGLMIGQFHPTCAEPAARNAGFPVSRSPLPLFAIRAMAQHDVLFLHQRADWFAEYDRRFGALCASGRVKDSHMRALYEESVLRYGSTREG